MTIEGGEHRIGDWVFAPRSGELRRDAKVVRLLPRSAAVLELLSARPGELVGKEELLAEVWSGLHVGDEVLAHAVWNIRKAFEDDARRPAYVETLPRRGYRLIAPVVRAPATGAAASDRVSGRLRHRFAAAGAVALVIALALAWVLRSERPSEPSARAAPSAPERPMIAVLPFENLGGPGREIFTRGIGEEITSRLASASGLGVISRRSAMRYAGSPKTVAEIGRELGADYLLTGAVRWAERDEGADEVRVTPRLIRVADDSHLWSQRFDRRVEDIFTVQSEIAQQVIEELGVTLEGRERVALAVRPTADLGAHAAYVQGLEAFRRAFNEEAARLFARAVELDPEFVGAWARLAQSQAARYQWGDASDDWRQLSAAALGRARELAPEAPEVRLAEGAYEYYARRAFGRAEEIFERLTRERPNDAEAFAFLGYVRRRRGKWALATAAMERAARLDPANEGLLWNLGGSYRELNRFVEADRVFDRCLEVAPGFSQCYSNKAWTLILWRGDTGAARAVLDSAPQTFEARQGLAWVDYLERDFGSALARLEGLGEPDTAARLTSLGASSLWRFAAGEPAAARATAIALLPRFERAARETPGDVVVAGTLAQLYALLGRRAEALEVGRRAVELGSEDALVGQWPRMRQIENYLLLGEVDEALGLLERELATPGWARPTVPYLRLDPLWDPVRENARFTALLERYG